MKGVIKFVIGYFSPKGVVDDDAQCVLHTTRQVSASGRSGGNWHRLAIRHRVSITSYNTVIG